MSSEEVGGEAVSSRVVKVEVVMEGYLEKKSPKSVVGLHAWQRRYFVLTLSTTDRGLNYKVLSYFKSAEEEEPLGNIPLINIRGVNVSTTDANRFDLVMSGRTYRLRSSSPEEVKKWVAAMSTTIEKPTYVHPAHLPKTAVETMKMMAESPEAAKIAEADKTIEMMRHGARFTKYEYDFVTHECERFPITLFYTSPSETDLGHLNWCGPDELKVIAEKNLPLSRLSDIYVGKHSRSFKHHIAGAAMSERCFTAAFSHPKEALPPSKGLNSSGLHELNLEGESKEQLAAWLFGINAIMMSRGKRKVVSGKRKNDAAKGTQSPSGAASPRGTSSTASTKTESSVSSSSSSAPNTDSLSEAQLEELNSAAPNKLVVKQIALDDDDKPQSNVPTSPSNKEDGKFKEVRGWLANLGTAFETYCQPFKENGVDMAFLLTCNDDDLEELGVSRLHRKRILHAIDELRVARGLNKRDDIPVVADGAPNAPDAPPPAPAPTSGSFSAKKDPLAALIAHKRDSLSKASGEGPDSKQSASVAAKQTVSMSDIIKGIKQAKLKRVEQKDDEVPPKNKQATPEFAKVSLRKASDYPAPESPMGRKVDSSQPAPTVQLRKASDRPKSIDADSNTPNALEEARKKMAEKKAAKAAASSTSSSSSEQLTDSATADSFVAEAQAEADAADADGPE